MTCLYDLFSMCFSIKPTVKADINTTAKKDSVCKCSSGCSIVHPVYEDLDKTILADDMYYDTLLKMRKRNVLNRSDFDEKEKTYVNHYIDDKYVQSLNVAYSSIPTYCDEESE